MAFARVLPILSEFTGGASVLLLGDDPATRVVLARGSSVR
jgi:hypothetical protein